MIRFRTWEAMKISMNAALAKKTLGWKPKVNVREVRENVPSRRYDILPLLKSVNPFSGLFLVVRAGRNA